jgi:hypothetical protein
MNKLWSSSGEQVRARWSFVLPAILSDIPRWRIRGGIYNQTIITQSIFPYRRGPARPCILPSDCGIWCCHNGVVRRRDKQAAEFSSEQGFAITRSVLFGAGRAEMVGDPASAQSISDTGTAGKGTYCTEDARERRDDEVHIIIRSYHHATFSFSPSFPVPKSKQTSKRPIHETQYKRIEASRSLAVQITFPKDRHRMSRSSEVTIPFPCCHTPACATPACATPARIIK